MRDFEAIELKLQTHLWCLFYISFSILLCSFHITFHKEFFIISFRDYLGNLKVESELWEKLHILGLCVHSPLVAYLYKIYIKFEFQKWDQELYWIQSTNFITSQIYYSYANISRCYCSSFNDRKKIQYCLDFIAKGFLYNSRIL